MMMMGTTTTEEEEEEEGLNFGSNNNSNNCIISGGGDDYDESESEEEEEKKIWLKHPPDPCLLCGEPAVHYDPEGKVIKRETPSSSSSRLRLQRDDDDDDNYYSTFFSCIFKCFRVEGRNHRSRWWHKAKKWMAEVGGRGGGPLLLLPICEACEELVDLLLQMYAKVEELESKIKTKATQAEGTFEAEELYMRGRNGEFYSTFRGSLKLVRRRRKPTSIKSGKPVQKKMVINLNRKQQSIICSPLERVGLGGGATHKTPKQASASAHDYDDDDDVLLSDPYPSTPPPPPPPHDESLSAENAFLEAECGNDDDDAEAVENLNKDSTRLHHPERDIKHFAQQTENQYYANISSKRGNPSQECQDTKNNDDVADTPTRTLRNRQEMRKKYTELSSAESDDDGGGGGAGGGASNSDSDLEYYDNKTLSLPVVPSSSSSSSEAHPGAGGGDEEAKKPSLIPPGSSKRRTITNTNPQVALFRGDVNQCPTCARFIAGGTDGLSRHELTHHHRTASSKLLKSSTGKGRRKRKVTGAPYKSKDFPFQCPKCPWCFKTWKGVQMHNTQCHRLDPHTRVHRLVATCRFPTCRRTFPTKAQRHAHYCQDHPNTKEAAAARPAHKSARCLYPGCTSAFSDESTLQSHVSQEHHSSNSTNTTSKVVGGCMCPQCGRVLTTESGLTKHALIHSKEKMHSCHRCPSASAAFRTKDLLNNHLASVHGEGPMSGHFRCELPGCNGRREYQNRTQYYKHMRKIHKMIVSGGVKMGRPKKSSEPLPSPRSPPTPSQMEHAGEGRHTTSKPKSATGEGRKRKVVTAGNKSVVVRCQYPGCFRGFPDEPTLQSHVVASHEHEQHCSTTSTKVGEFMCPRCGRVLKTDYRLKLHTLIHSKEKAHVCPHCRRPSRAFRTKNLLNCHLAAVHGEGPASGHFPCGQPGCDKEYKSRDPYRKHMRRVHKMIVSGNNVKRGRGPKTKSVSNEAPPSRSPPSPETINGNNFVGGSDRDRQTPTTPQDNKNSTDSSSNSLPVEDDGDGGVGGGNIHTYEGADSDSGRPPPPFEDDIDDQPEPEGRSPPGAAPPKRKRRMRNIRKRKSKAGNADVDNDEGDDGGDIIGDRYCRVDRQTGNIFYTIRGASRDNKVSINLEFVKQSDGRSYKCAQCSRNVSFQEEDPKRSIIDRRALLSHARRFHPSGRSGICPVCDMPVASVWNSEYYDHRLTHLSEEERAEALANPLYRKMTNGKSYPYPRLPPMVGKKTNISPELALLRADVLQCPTCGRFITGGASGLERHELTHLPTEQRVRPHLCASCGAAFTVKYSLDMHVLRAHPSGDDGEASLFKCALCPRHYKTEKSLRIHMEREGDHTATKNLFACSTCPRSYLTRKGLLLHTSWAHKGGRNLLTAPGGFSCKFSSYCSKTFGSKEELVAHYLESHGNSQEAAKLRTPDKSFMCRYPSCTSLGFPDEVQLQNHVSTEHATAGPPSTGRMCSKCGRVLVNDWSLSQHLLIHSKEKKVGCPRCSRTFLTKDLLYAHLASIHGEGPIAGHFPCEQPGCGKEYQSRNQYYQHMRQVHKMIVSAKGKRRRKMEEEEEEGVGMGKGSNNLV